MSFITLRRSAPKTNRPACSAPLKVAPTLSIPSAPALHPIVQAKLRIGAPNDKFEQEADRVAEQVMRMPDATPAAESPPISLTGPEAVQRTCAACANGGTCPKCEEKLRRQPMEEEDELQAKQGPGNTPAVTPEVQTQIDSLRGGGQPLDPATRALMESRFGYDFSRVRVHSGASAEQSAHDVNANAYTVGHNIVFGAGRFAPGTNEGQRLIAHELTHVVQQSGREGNRVGQGNGNRGLSPIFVPEVTQVLARDPNKPNSKPASAHGKKRDVHSMSEAEIRKEIDRNFAEQERPQTPRKRWLELSERGTELQEELERRSNEAWDTALAAAALEGLQEMITRATRTNDDFDKKLHYAIETLAAVEKRLVEYLGYYEEAYDRFVAVLAKAKSDAAARKQRYEIVSGILIGTGVGLAAGAILKFAKGAYTVVAEAGSEVVESVLGGLGDADSPDFAPPANLDPKLHSIPVRDQIMDAWRGLGKFNLTTHAFGNFRYDLLQLATDLKDDPTKERVAQVYQLVARLHIENIQGKLDELHESVYEFLVASGHPLLRKLAWDIEQDLWIQWIDALREKDEEAYHGLSPRVSSALAEAEKQGLVHLPRPSFEALDEGVIEKRLEEIGVLGARGGESRLGVDFGRWTTASDTEDAQRAARREVTQLNQVGRYGVVSDDIGPKGRGTVRIRNDLHEKLGKKPPTDQGPEGTFPAVLWSTDPVKAWQIVRVMGTSSKGLEVQPAYDKNYAPVFI